MTIANHHHNLDEGAPLVRLEWDQAARLLAQAQTIAVVTHVQPDGDAIGSLMGLTLALRSQGKAATPFVDGGVPKHLAFVPSAGEVCPAPEGAALAYDLIISVDSSDPERLGKCGEALRNSRRPLIQLDHHQTNLLFGDANLVNAAQASACEVVLDWLDRLGWTLSPEVAQSLLTGIVTDTLCFRTSNVTAETFEKAQRLMRAGAALVEIVQYTMARMSTNLIRLYGRVLPKMQIEKGVIWVAVTREDFAAAGMQNGNYTGLSGYLIQADEACISASFIATNGNDVECSFRAVPGYDVGQIALRLGGGGHVLAGGCTLRGVTLEEALAQVLPLLQAEAARGKPVYQLPS